MKAGLFFILFIVPLTSFAHWTFIKGSEKNDVFQTHVLVRHVPMGSAASLGAVVQNTLVSSQLYRDFKNETPEMIANYLLKPFPGSIEKEKLGNVYLYRAQTQTDHIRLMVKKRKKDFLISFAMIKKPFLYRSYNETDFFQRLFIAAENQKSKEPMTSKLFQIPIELPAFLMGERAHAANFSSASDQLLNSVKGLRGQIKLSSTNNFLFATEKIAPALNGIGDRVQNFGNNVVSGWNNGVSAINNGSASINGLSRQVRNLTSGENWVGPGVGLGIGISVGTMFSNVAALAIGSAYNALKRTLFDYLEEYNEGEEEEIKKQVNKDWAEYEVLQNKMTAHEMQLQELEIALQVASGKPIEEIFDMKSVAVDGVVHTIALNSNSCSPLAPPMTLAQIENLRVLGEMIKNNSEVRDSLCVKFDKTLGLIETQAKEMNLMRTKISANILAHYNAIVKDKQTALDTPDLVGKADKQCQKNADKTLKSHSAQYEERQCTKNPNDKDCLELKGLMARVQKRIDYCKNTRTTVTTRFKTEYVNTALSLEDWQTKVEAANDEFLRSDCVKGATEPYCNNEEGVVANVKRSYNEKLETFKKSDVFKDSKCSTLKSPRFTLGTEVLAGQLPPTQAGLDAKMVPDNSARPLDKTNTTAINSYATRTDEQIAKDKGEISNGSAPTSTTSDSPGIFSYISSFFSSIGNMFKRWFF